jgi:hypothetical protein
VHKSKAAVVINSFFISCASFASNRPMAALGARPFTSRSYAATPRSCEKRVMAALIVLPEPTTDVVIGSYDFL